MLCICIDAFKPDYLRCTKYLKSIAKESMHGELESILGFSGITATFLTGTFPKKHGIVSMFDYSPRSSVGWVGKYSFLGRTMLNIAINLNRYLRDQRFFFKIPKMPIKWMKYFDTCLNKAFPQAGSLRVKSLYDILRENDKTFCAVDWPNVIHSKGRSVFMSHSKEKILSITEKMLRKDPDFCFTHFFELDYVAHEFGTTSKELKDEVRMLDETIEKLDTDDLFVFSDHGMIDVKGGVDIAPLIEDTGLEFGKDFAYFLDSTMARFWFRKGDAGKEIEEKLLDIKGGHVLTQQQIGMVYKLPLDCCDMIFLADPGIVIKSNFFQGDEPVKAMHGYDPRQPDQFAFYLLKTGGEKKSARMVDMLPTLLDFMNLPGIKCDGKSLL